MIKLGNKKLLLLSMEKSKKCSSKFIEMIDQENRA